MNIATKIDTGHAAPVWTRVDWADPLLLEAELPVEERMIRGSARAFCEAELAPAVLKANRLAPEAISLIKRNNYGRRSRSPGKRATCTAATASATTTASSATP